jgi:hypothetical protein
MNVQILADHLYFTNDKILTLDKQNQMYKCTAMNFWVSLTCQKLHTYILVQYN